MPLDLDAYLARIGWTGPRSPDHATLCGLLRHHMTAIPFENLDVLLGRPVRIDLDAVQAKLVQDRRGGYCFQHATLFGAVLDALGFRTARHAARVVLVAPRAQAPRDHMFLTVALADQRFVVDPGFGGFGPPVPLPLTTGATAGTAHRMIRNGEEWVLEIEREGQPADAWMSTLAEEGPADFEMANHFTSTHPASPFRNLIMMSRLTADGRVTVMNRDATLARAAEVETRHLADRRAFRAFLQEQFSFDLPEAERLAVPAIPEWH